MGKKWNVALVGAMGEVGWQMIEILAERKFPVGKIRCMSDSGVGEIMEFNGKPVVVEELSRASFAGVDIALFAADGVIAGEFCPRAAAAGALCIDVSSTWRMDPDVPLVVPEVNAHAISAYSAKGIIAVPTGAAIQLAIALKPLHDFGRIRRIVISTYQAVSGAGKNGIEELRAQTIDLMNGRQVKCKAFPQRIAFNCLPHTGSFEEGGYSSEEMRITDETAKVMASDIRGTATTVLVPVFYGLSQAVNIETEKKITAAKASKLLADAPGCKLVDKPEKGLYPMPSEAAGQDLIQVGRVREDRSIENGINLWLAGDDVRNRANCAVRIAELLIEKHLQ
jgi:aspartate-semialdehyde dehydrogenase